MRVNRLHIIASVRRICVPVGHEDRGEQAPDVQQHADPARHDPHPHGDLGASNVNVLFMVRVRVRLDHVPSERMSLGFRTRMQREAYQSVSNIATYMAPIAKMTWNQAYCGDRR